MIGDICEALGKEADVFGSSHIVDGSRIKHEIFNTGVIIYEK
jgi:hypothetical protein